MNDYKSQYYINNIPWQRNLNYDNILKFKSISYGDAIIFHYDFVQSIFKVVNQSKGYNKNIFISAINACLRYKQIIQKLYPYNKVYIIIHTRKNMRVSIDYNTFKKILDIIPNFAICDNLEDCLYFDTKQYKHIAYGTCSNILSNLKNSEKQKWTTVQGNLIIKGE